MQDIDMLKIYKEALNDYYTLMNKYNAVEDKSFDNLKIVFADQSNNDDLFYEITQGTIKAYLTIKNGIGTISTNIIIDREDYFSAFIDIDEIKEIIRTTIH